MVIYIGGMSVIVFTELFIAGAIFQYVFTILVFASVEEPVE